MSHAPNTEAPREELDTEAMDEVEETEGTRMFQSLFLLLGIQIGLGLAIFAGGNVAMIGGVIALACTGFLTVVGRELVLEGETESAR